MNFLGYRLKELREQKNMSQEVLAERSNLRQGEISAIERGDNTNPNGGKVIAIARALGISNAGYFYYEDEQLMVEKINLPPGYTQIIIPEEDSAFIDIALKSKSLGMNVNALQSLIEMVKQIKN